ncbi:hypothetical protein RI129_008043 [Pyrocoelia pectoralis]|uniref:DDE Tnp4 domain-containing protein n=1 Tax=Pyrocoelia pectoralis TaxID=417401 RepID=A0AAN7ZM38_9COLE
MDEFEMFLYFYLLYQLYLLVLGFNLQNSPQRRWWVRPANRSRNKDGYFINNYLQLKEIDPEDFFKHTRMTRNLYNRIINLLEPELTKHSIRKPISFECRLALTLSYLSQGVSHQFLAWSFKMGKATVRKIILETCETIWKVLSPLHLPPLAVQDYEHISEEFRSQWNMPHCVGSIDGKYINIKCPPNSGSLYYDHKGNYSIVMLAACNADYCFTFVDVGAYGSQSDGGILSASLFGQALLNKTLPLPADKTLPNSRVQFPHYFVGDSAFPLKDNIMRPYPGKLLDERRRIFNYRLSRARRIIENCFGILVTRWRILQNNVHASPHNATNIVLACVALHNYIKTQSLPQSRYCPPQYIDWEDADGVLHHGEWRNDLSAPLQSVRLGSNNATRTAFQLRDLLSNYFLEEGAVTFQYNRD